jgi:hypothetical protein
MDHSLAHTFEDEKETKILITSYDPAITKIKLTNCITHG